MMNIQTAIRQMRVARRLGKLSAEQASRLLRRLGHPAVVAQHKQFAAAMTAAPSPEAVQLWDKFMDLRNTIEAEVLPKLEAKRKADDLLFNPADRRKAYTVMDACLDQAASVKVEAPKLEGYEFTPEWWKEAEKREREQRKAEHAEVD